jgi:hypothetical protein
LLVEPERPTTLRPAAVSELVPLDVGYMPIPAGLDESNGCHLVFLTVQFVSPLVIERIAVHQRPTTSCTTRDLMLRDEPERKLHYLNAHEGRPGVLQFGRGGEKRNSWDTEYLRDFGFEARLQYALAIKPPPPLETADNDREIR